MSNYRWKINSNGLAELRRLLKIATGHDHVLQDEIDSLNKSATYYRDRYIYGSKCLLVLSALKTLYRKEVIITIDTDTHFDRDWNVK